MPIRQYAIKRVLTEKEFDNYINLTLQTAIDNNEQMFRCPNNECNAIIERINNNNNHHQNANNKKVLGNDGKPLSNEAINHRDEYRIRCRTCNIDFCSLNMTSPYHIGYTCQQYTDYINSAKCRFCQDSISNHNKYPNNEKLPGLNEVCNDDECREKAEICCGTILDCGHFCGGIRDENEHLTCLESECEAFQQSGLNQNGEDFCNICWVEDLSSSPSLQVKCGHIFHYNCLRQKMKEKWPSARITFGFWNCPLCKTPIEHEALDDLISPIKKLKKEIEIKALQRLKFEGLEKAESIVKPGEEYYNNPLGYSMKRFAYYPCFKCGKPYFGGQVQCNAGDGRQDFAPEDLICGGCSNSNVASSCPIHERDYIEHKCQFCCAVATWFCWGKTHFCDSCHTKQQNGDYVTRYPKEKLPKCPGKKNCPLRIDHPPNGEPFTLGCVLCRNLNDF
eukprot:TRINITY_DN3106_c1_g1_i1.p1 TRINITY_DN3106_c1_g1~~TRINITY_DN3106_c1_g1_i1.p1  ORF type:complete len:449 (-),score=163.39 TRINITY_DN3106_c1_g1_i1:81-1427(-)